MEKLYIKNIFKGIDENIKFDEEQIKVILDNSQNLIVIAGAGSGKTTTLAAKVKYLVDIKKINSNEILIISLTNKAINELKSRINGDFGLDVNICTFHKLAYDLLKKEESRYKVCSEPTKIIRNIIYSEKDTIKIIKLLKRNKDYRKVDKRYFDSRELLFNLVYELIQLIKILNIDLNKIKTNRKVNLYVNYLKKVMNEYNDILNKNFQLDFEDLILEASKLSEYGSTYKYIIVDEYQDISLNRLNFLKNLVDKTNAKTIVVGDDFQTIYSFAGSNINLFLNYAEDMNATVLKITNTYRNSQELIDIAGSFVMKNDKQIKKVLHSLKTCINPIEIYGYKNDFDIVFEKIIIKIINENSKDKKILILGRYKRDIELIKSRSFNIKGNRVTYLREKDVTIDFLTIHASKGLGYDNVILINFIDDYMGFPSKVEDLDLKKEIIGKHNSILEERRLFYVALTRTKNKVYIMTKKNRESVFMYDIYNDKNVYIDYKFRYNKKNKNT